tara:strand:+ start:247 stop:807 length:561 start_codon:yes stop_codon:yes gene_type:complete
MGNWVKGVRSGIGTFYYANGSEYHGQWVDNKKEGFGCHTFENGLVWEGVFENDRMPKRPTKQSGKDGHGGRATDDVATQIRLNVSDIVVNGNSTEVGGNSNTSHELALLERQLLRYHTELKLVFKHYASVPTSHSASKQSSTSTSAASSFTMTMSQLRILNAECRITNVSTLSHANVCEIFYRMRR